MSRAETGARRDPVVVTIGFRTPPVNRSRRTGPANANTTASRLQLCIGHRAHVSADRAANRGSAPRATLSLEQPVHPRSFNDQQDEVHGFATAENRRCFFDYGGTTERSNTCLLQLITPLPYSPPMMNAAFLTDGMTATQAAFSRALRNVFVAAPESRRERRRLL